VSYTKADWARMFVASGLTFVVVVLVGQQIIGEQAKAIEAAEPQVIGPPGFVFPGIELKAALVALGIGIFTVPYLYDRGLGDRS